MAENRVKKDLDNFEYNSTSGEITLFKDGEKKIFDMVSEPIYDENKKQIAFIHPYQWEVRGDIYIYNLDSKKLKIFSFNETPKKTPKFLSWIDENKLLCLIGDVFGTIDISGKVLLISLQEKSDYKVIKKFPKDVQINSMSENGDTIDFIGIKYIDESLHENYPYMFKIKKIDILSK